MTTKTKTHYHLHSEPTITTLSSAEFSKCGSFWPSHCK